jgi:16S rRNA (cytosine1402-N4)-methyltransferase
MTIHKSVLLKETIENLQLKKGMVVVDATLGGGGHSKSILERIGPDGTLIAIDLDENALEGFKFQILNSKFQIIRQPADQLPNFKIENAENVFLVRGNFADLKNILVEIGIKKVDAILADLGWSSDQLSGRGMSFQKDEELDMRFDRNQELTAKKIVNEYPQKDLEKIIERYGEERFYKNIAKRIIEFRKKHTIETTTQLADIVKNAVPPKNRSASWRRKIDPATRTFQALRIEVNHELENLEKFIPVAIESLKTEGRLGIITFHSLEDRLVKNSFRENAGGCICPPDFPQCVCGKKPKIRIITKKPIAPSRDEVFSNPRARSAKLRVVEKQK